MRRRREDDTYAATKRRKLTENSHLEVPPLHINTSKEKVAPPSDDCASCETSTVAKKRTTRTKKNTSTAKKVQSGGRGRRAGKGASTNTTYVPNIQTLFKLINETNQREQKSESDQAGNISSNTADTRITNTDHSSDECPLPSKTASKEGTPKSSPFKAPLIPPLSKSKPSTPLKSSPLKAATAPSSPAASSSLPETRGARLLRLAREKMSAKSPDSKTAPPSVTSSPTVERSKKMASRRKLLVSDGLSTTNSACQSASCFFSSKEESREKMMNELYKMSKTELAQPTMFERGKKIKQGQKVDGGKKKEAFSNKSPMLREFGAFVFESPTKSKASETK